MGYKYDHTCTAQFISSFPAFSLFSSMRNDLMKTNNCVEITDTKSREMTNGLTEPGKQHQPYGFIIPAGILIGLGVGLLVDHLVSGFLVGLGLGFLGSGLLPLVRKPLGGSEFATGKTDVTMLLIGAFLVFIGMAAGAGTCRCHSRIYDPSRPMVSGSGDSTPSPENRIPSSTIKEVQVDHEAVRGYGVDSEGRCTVLA